MEFQSGYPRIILISATSPYYGRLFNGALCQCLNSTLLDLAQSMLEWAFTLYFKYPYGDARLPDTLISVGCLAHDFAMDKEDKVVASLGVQLLQWIGKQALEFCKVPPPSGDLFLRRCCVPIDPGQDLPRC